METTHLKQKACVEAQDITLFVDLGDEPFFQVCFSLSMKTLMGQERDFELKVIVSADPSTLFCLQYMCLYNMLYILSSLF